MSVSPQISTPVHIPTDPVEVEIAFEKAVGTVTDPATLHAWLAALHESGNCWRLLPHLATQARVFDTALVDVLLDGGRWPEQLSLPKNPFLTPATWDLIMTHLAQRCGLADGHIKDWAAAEMFEAVALAGHVGVRHPAFLLLRASAASQIAALDPDAIAPFNATQFPHIDDEEPIEPESPWCTVRLLLAARDLEPEALAAFAADRRIGLPLVAPLVHHPRATDAVWHALLDALRPLDEWNVLPWQLLEALTDDARALQSPRVRAFIQAHQDKLTEEQYARLVATFEGAEFREGVHQLLERGDPGVTAVTIALAGASPAALQALDAEALFPLLTHEDIEVRDFAFEFLSYVGDTGQPPVEPRPEPIIYLPF